MDYVLTATWNGSRTLVYFFNIARHTTMCAILKYQFNPLYVLT